jgi:hypothetical protein
MGVPEITGWDLLILAIVIGFIGWGSIELVIILIKWLIHHLQWI